VLSSDYVFRRDDSATANGTNASGGVISVHAPQSLSSDRIVPLIVAVSLFMENMDSTVISTSLPAIALALGTNPLALKLAVTSYLLALAICIPASGWTADRFGARNVFRAAITVFVIGSIGCALSGSLTQFVCARIVQGMGGAMMTPVGRLIMLRSIDKRALLNAMSLLTMPALIGPICGPPLGGFITTYASWHWIFIINVPIGLIGIVMASRYIENVRATAQDPFDLRGMILAGLGIGGLAFGLSVMGLDFLPVTIVGSLIGVGAVSTIAYIVHARRTPAPVLDLSLLKIPTYRASVYGGFMFRLGIGALPFLLPLLLQIGFHLTPFQSGMITFTGALGSMFMKAAITSVLGRFGYRNVLMVNALISAGFLAACATFIPGMPFWAMIAILLTGGFFRSLQFTSINTIAYADIEPRMMSRATSLFAAAQQLSLSTGVAVGALVVEVTLRLKGQPTMTTADFPAAFLIVGLISAFSALVFARLAPDAGAELTNRRRVATVPPPGLPKP
jgi:EmrB/QacA subfamily drug resistance transporter